MECKYCKNEFHTKSSLNHHQNTAKYCLKMQGVKNSSFICSSCEKTFSNNYNLSVHIVSCGKSKISLELKEKLYKTETQLEQIIKIVEQKDIIINDQKKIIKDLQDKLEKITIKAVSRNFEDKTTIKIDDNPFTMCDSEESDNETYEENNYKITPLEVGNGYTIEYREEDGYINITQLCKAGGKEFKHWKSIDKTHNFLKILSDYTGISEANLINIGTGSKNIGTGSKNKYSQNWGHPYVATNIAQWISNEFSVKISIWIEEWKNDKNNKEKYKTAITEIKCDNNDKKEKEIQLKLQTKLGGQIEVQTYDGFIDLLTENEVIEIKRAKNWKHAVGQILIYSIYYPTHNKRIHLFDVDENFDIEYIKQKVSNFNIILTHE